MTLPADLLEQAGHLLGRERKRPKIVSLRRSTSAAYYAIFHLLSAECAAVLAPNMSEPMRNQLQRSLNHADMKQACSRFLQTPPTNAIAVLTTTPVTTDLKTVALAFIQLQEARISADYDLNSDWTRSKSTAHLQAASDAFAAWRRIRKTSEANLFLLSFLLLKQLDSTR